MKTTYRYPILAIVFSMLLNLISSVSYATETEEHNILYNIDYSPLVRQIEEDYYGIYEFDNFEFKTFPFEIDGEKYVGIDVLVDMTLVRHPSESPYFKGMNDSIKNYNLDDNHKLILKEKMNERINQVVDEYYLIPNRTTFSYAMKLDTLLNKEVNLKSKNTTLNEFFYRVDSDVPTLYRANDLRSPEDKSLAYDLGYKQASQMINNVEKEERIKSSNALYRTSSYDRIAARDWARDNAYASPEYPSSEVPGTDCANFVSKAIRAGGIREDRPGKWYGSSYWGGWSGDNWLRTGNGTDGGVVPYMTGINSNVQYFYLENDTSSVSTGAIMNWIDASHVALVTYGDGVTIKYTQHGARQTKDTVYRPGSVNAEFYMYY